MTILLWIIGIIAVAWPVIVALYLDSQFTKHFNLLAARSESSHLAEERSNGVREQIEKIQDMLEKQDALIAALWQSAFGFERNGDYGGFITPEYLGIKPDWRPFDREWVGPVVYITRHSPYPWGTYAEPLYFPE